MKGVWVIIKSIFKFIQGLGTTALGLLVILLLVGVYLGSNRDTRPSVPTGAVMVLWPNGMIVEQAEYPDPLEEVFTDFNSVPPQTSIHDILRSLERAKRDDRIKAVAVLTDNMFGAAPSHLHAIADGIRDFKESGKKVYAISSAYSQGTYMIAAEADKVYMNPLGSVLLTGFGSYPTYFKDMLDKIEANVNVFRVGTYKAAVEPFIRNDMSPAAKEANMAFLNSLWDQYEGSVVEARALQPGALTAAMQTVNADLRAVNGDFAQLAVSNGLVDELAPRATWRQALMDEYGATPDGTSFKQIHFQAYLAATDRPNRSRNEIAVITAQGEIVMGEGPITVTAAETTAGYIRDARNNPNTSAIVLRVDSPGGSAFASEIIRQELVAAQESGLKVIASFGPVAASGGYWISATADEIWAAPSTITGSIGIFGIVPTFERTLEKVGIHTDGVGTSPLAGAFNITRPMSDSAKDIIQQSIEAGYGQFLSLVAEGRNMSVEDVDKIAQGRVWVGTKAHELGLVDHLGDFGDAVKAAATSAGVEDFNLVFYRDQPDKFDQMLASLMNSSLGDNFKGLSGNQMSPLMKTALELKTEAEKLFRFNDPDARYAVCFVCKVRD
ncbi:signal peptide peptidase SppA [Kordiimonas sp.]|uniref:signal peptide peptidase SppA n=1 Tax=Kordiimonas sp. TaxID=1970157 RepID=UPI003A913F01